MLSYVRQVCQSMPGWCNCTSSVGFTGSSSPEVVFEEDFDVAHPSRGGIKGSLGDEEKQGAVGRGGVGVGVTPHKNGGEGVCCAAGGR
jgi:hypothetical protein